MLKPEYLFFAAEIFLNAPSGKVEFCNPDDIFPGTDFFICSQHHGMLRDAVDQDKVDVFSGSRDLHFYMGKIGIMVFAFIIKRHFDLALALFPQLCRRDLFPMEEELAPCRKANDVVLLQPMKFQEHLVVIVSPVHDESGLSEQGGCPFHC